MKGPRFFFASWNNLPSLVSLVLSALFSMLGAATFGQHGERTLKGTVSTSDYRAPFGDDVEIFNLGDRVNSAFSEYNPVISPDAQYMLFTTRHDSVAGEKLYEQDRQPFEDMHIARSVDGRYVSNDDVDHPLRTFASSVNTRKHEAPVYVTDDAETIILFRENDLWFSRLENGVYTEPEKYSKHINFKYYHRHASLTKDGKTMVFTAEVLDKKLNRFHLDIFQTNLDDNGNWSKPERLPTYINSPYNEDSPEISPDGKLLFFSSDRKDGLGGYDVYYVELMKNDSTLHRLAPPINSAADDIYFKMIEDSTIAFVSSNRLGGYGEMDIYKILFHRFDVESCNGTNVKNSLVSINGLDTVRVNSRLILNSFGSKIGGVTPRTTHWYLNDSLVSVTDRLDLAMRDTGKHEVKLYISVIDEKQLRFHSACIAQPVYVLDADQYAKNSKVADALKGLDNELTERQLRLALPAPSGEIGLQNDAATTYINNPVIIKVFENDGDDHSDFTLESVGRPLNGSSVIEDVGAGKVLYHPAEDFVGIDAFSYTVRTPFGRKGQAMVGIRVLDNDLFTNNKQVKDDLVSTPKNEPVTISLFDNDELPEGIRSRIAETTLPVNGTLSGIDLNTGTLIYKPNRDFVGSDVFTYSVQVPELGKQKAFVRVNVVGEKGELPSKTRPDFASTMEGKLLSMNVFLNDRFNEADQARITTLSKTQNGASQIYDAEDGTIVFAPYKSFSGYEYFTYTAEVKDGSNYVEAVSIFVEPEEVILASVDEATGKQVDQGSGASVEAGKPTELYNITSVDEEKVDLSKRPAIALEEIYFDFDKVYIRRDARETMENNIALLKDNPKAVIQIVSHCDSRGPKAYNMILSARRAKSTMQYLVANGISKDRIVAAVGVGEDDLVNDCGDGVPCSKADHQQNRRSELIVIGSLRD